jgi:hypothetical protein
MGSGYIMQLLFSEKLQICNNSITAKAREKKNKHRFGILRNLEKF